MAVIIARVQGKGLQQAKVHACLINALKDKFTKTDIHVSTDVEKPLVSRPDRFADAMNRLCGAKEDLEALCNELQDWKDNLPENLQDGDKANALDEAIGELEEIIEAVDGVSSNDVTFPSMY